MVCPGLAEEHQLGRRGVPNPHGVHRRLPFQGENEGVHVIWGARRENNSRFTVKAVACLACVYNAGVVPVCAKLAKLCARGHACWAFCGFAGFGSHHIRSPFWEGVHTQPRRECCDPVRCLCGYVLDVNQSAVRPTREQLPALVPEDRNGSRTTWQHTAVLQQHSSS